MAGVDIDLTGAVIPRVDGEINTYESLEAKSQPEYWSNQSVIFVNGMKNSGFDHAKSAVALSLVQMRPVIGVYNRTAGAISDLAQCVADKNQFNGLSFSAQNKARIGTFLTDKTREVVISEALSRNPPQLSLFNLLRRPENRRKEVFAHSQGNLILCNALQGIAAVDGPHVLKGLVVHTFGSPTVNWPAGIVKYEQGYTFDPVNWLSGFDSSFTISKVGMPVGSLNPITHGFLEYLKQDPEFIINRFRVGMWSMTFNMDEDGLANCLFAMGPNMPRVKNIMEFMNEYRNSDADDVALIYVKLLKTSTTHIQALKSNRDLVALLIKVMDEGYTTSEEQQAIDWLTTLR